MLRAAFAHAGGIRIDHVLGLTRMWLVPDGADATDGAYLRYPFDDLLRLVALESWRHRAIVIGEDLGTVPEGLPERLVRGRTCSASACCGSSAVARAGPAVPRRRTNGRTRALAVTTTHDLPTTAGWWSGRDIDWRAKLSLFGDHSTEAAGARRARRRSAACCGTRCARPASRTANVPPPTDPPIVEALRFVGATPAPLALSPVEDVARLRRAAEPARHRRLPSELAHAHAATGRAPARRRRHRGAPRRIRRRTRPALTVRVHIDSTRMTDKTDRRRRRCARTTSQQGRRAARDRAAAVPQGLHLRPGDRAGPVLRAPRRQPPVRVADPEGAARLDARLRLRRRRARQSRTRRRGRRCAGWPTRSTRPAWASSSTSCRTTWASAADNAWWQDVLLWGPDSRYAHYFDIDWQSTDPALRGKLLAPFLGYGYGETLASGDLVLAFDDATRLRGALLRRTASRSRSPITRPFSTAPVTPDLHDAARLFERVVAIGDLPRDDAARARRRCSRDRDARSPTARDSLAVGASRSDDARSAIDRAIAAPCDVDAPKVARGCTRCSRAQSYRLASWRVAADEINWRRFFEVTELAGIRVERDEVFDAMHATIFRLYREGVIDCGAGRPRRRPRRPARLLPRAAVVDSKSCQRERPRVALDAAVDRRREDPRGRRGPARATGRSTARAATTS